ncbi:MAG: Gfo/Idh/MocA family oxidoreductase [Bosea sp.]|uniref:Gfo/Idh/MocA family protein n=1 Tax=Bosea sp. (in: a-proteobacteria) TaxID=1871050 RepID=UPI0023A2BBCB|nr:Gfo/Idh/MocA family oxidoreductase [Bosea sp. (in: a-proteobacteria)]MCP4734457.1 Gfo/Idh/MocA family oxidoreductase [Bosea sp. (in: a-proteobacteria)]
MAIEASTTQKLNRRLRLGMVGGGRGAFIGAVHRIASRLDDRWQLVAGALSSDPARGRLSGEDLLLDPARLYADAAEMAKREKRRKDGIDAVAIVTPNHAHAPAAKAFLKAGIHVICDKPLTTSLREAESLAKLAGESGLIFAVTHNYTGYPLVRQARAMVAEGVLGRLRVVQVEYAQDWLATKLEESGQKQAEWRTDPARSGPAGSIGDIGSHAFNLAEFIAGDEVEALAAEAHVFVEGRRLDDNAHMLLRFKGGARGMLWCSQVAAGQENGLRIRLYGEKGGLEWQQENPNLLLHSPLGEPPRLIRRAGAGTNAVANAASRIPAGHPEGYLEGFAQLYTDIAEQIAARVEAREPAPFSTLVPTVSDGVRGIRFIETAVRSSAKGARWLEL